MSINWVVSEIRHSDWRKLLPRCPRILCTKRLRTVSWNRLICLNHVLCYSQQIVHTSVIPNRSSLFCPFLIQWLAETRVGSTPRHECGLYLNYDLFELQKTWRGSEISRYRAGTKLKSQVEGNIAIQSTPIQQHRLPYKILRSMVCQNNPFIARKIFLCAAIMCGKFDTHNKNIFSFGFTLISRWLVVMSPIIT
jgi:hypothetical protein